MEIFSLIIMIFVVVWAYRIEINTARTAEALKRIEGELVKKHNSKE